MEGDVEKGFRGFNRRRVAQRVPLCFFFSPGFLRVSCCRILSWDAFFVGLMALGRGVEPIELRRALAALRVLRRDVVAVPWKGLG